MSFKFTTTSQDIFENQNQGF